MTSNGTYLTVLMPQLSHIKSRPTLQLADYKIARFIKTGWQARDQPPRAISL